MVIVGIIYYVYYNDLTNSKSNKHSLYDEIYPGGFFTHGGIVVRLHRFKLARVILYSIAFCDRFKVVHSRGILKINTPQSDLTLGYMIFYTVICWSKILTWAVA